MLDWSDRNDVSEIFYVSGFSITNMQGTGTTCTKCLSRWGIPVMHMVSNANNC